VIIDDETAAAILAPIADGVGADGRETEDEDQSGRFRELRSQRKAIFRDEQRVAMGGDPADSDNWDWEELAEHARDYLIGDAKDLEPMAMVIEAAVRVDGLAGLDRTMNLMADLVATYWDQGLYPPEDEDDGIEARFQPLSGLSGGTNDKEGTLIMPLRRMVLAGTPGGELRYIDRVAAEAQFASAQTASPDARAGLTKAAEAAYSAIDGIALAQSAAVLRAAIAQLESAQAGWRRGVDFIYAKAKPKMPAASRVTDELRKMRDWLAALLKKLPDDGGDVAAEAEATVAAEGGAPVAVAVKPDGPMVIGQINKRDDALRAVAAAADYFERVEPQSPLGNTLREVDRRARMSLNALLEELIPDGKVRQDYYWRAGIKPPGDK